MSIFVHRWRAIVIACGLAWLAPATSLAAPARDPGAMSASISAATEPFELSVSALTGGALMEKWSKLAHRLDDERVQLALCDGDRDNCASPAALRFLTIVDLARQREGRARLGVINRAVNLAIRPMSDLAQYGEVDVWSSPLVTFDHGAGDCEDYAIAKFMALRQAGMAAEDLRIVILRDTFHGEDHAVLAARLDGHWLMLDNMRMALVEDVNVRNYRPLFAVDETGVMRYSDLPLLAHATGGDAVLSVPDPRPGRIGVSD